MTGSIVDKDIQKNRLLWRCRRGTRELELLLYRYIDEYYDSLSQEEIQLFKEFVEQDHNDLNSWLLNQDIPCDNNRFNSIIKAILHIT